MASPSASPNGNPEVTDHDHPQGGRRRHSHSSWTAAAEAAASDGGEAPWPREDLGFSIDRRHRLSWACPRAEEALGSGASLRGTSLLDVVHADDRFGLAAVLRRAWRDGRAALTVRLFHPPGTFVRYRLQLVRVDVPDGGAHVFAVAEDARAAWVQEVFDKLQEQGSAPILADQNVARLVTSALSSLAVAARHLELLEGRQATPPGTRRSLGLLRRTLAAARWRLDLVAAITPAGRPRPVAVALLAREAWEPFAALAEAGGVAAALDVPAGMQVHVEADAARAMLHHLLARAVDAAGPGGAVALCARRGGAGVELTIGTSGTPAGRCGSLAVVRAAAHASGGSLVLLEDGAEVVLTLPGPLDPPDS